MTVLEIVLTSVLGGLIFVGAIYLFLLHTNTENRLQLFEVLNERAEPDPIVFFGDSLTDFFPVQDFFPNQTIYNRGIAGDTTRDLLKRIDNVIALKPTHILMQIGTNDLGRGHKVERVVKNIEHLIDIFQIRLPDTTLSVISLYPVSHRKMWLSFLIAGLRKNKNIVAVNKALAEITKKRGLTFIDIHPLLVDKKGRMAKEFTLEGLHISGLGYGVIAEKIGEYLH